MFRFDVLAERRILEAMERGEFDRLPGAGRITSYNVCYTKLLRLRTTINSSVFNSLLHSAQIGANGDVFIVNKSGELQTPSLQGNLTALPSGELSLVRHHSTPELVQVGDTLYATTWLNNATWIV